MSIALEYARSLEKSNTKRFDELYQEITKAGMRNQFIEIMRIIDKPCAVYSERLHKGRR